MNIAIRKNCGSPAPEIECMLPLDLRETAAPGSGAFTEPEILLLDDGSQNMEMIACLLQAQGCQVFLSPDSQTAMEEVGNYHFDLIISRLTRKNLDGLAVLKKARELNPQIKVMVLDGHPDMTLPLEAFELGADDYLQLPCRASELCRRVGRCLGREMGQPVKAELTSRASEINKRVLNSLRIFCHDVRSSLVSVGASLKLVGNGKGGQMDDTVAESVEQIHTKVSKLVGLTEDFIGKTVLTDRVFNFEPQTLDLHRDIINQVMDEFNGDQELPQVIVKIRHKSTNGDGIPIRGNKVLLKSVFRNLLNNAIKYGDKDGSIEIGLEGNKSYWKVNVFNNGYPISIGKRKTLFSQLNLGGNHGHAKTDGLGIGLNLIGDIIKHHGGEMRYEPKEHGSNFIFTLPRC